jgi:cytochrome P450
LPPQGRLGPLRLYRALRKNAITAWRQDAFEKPYIADRNRLGGFVLLNEPDLIRHVLIDNAANYRRAAFQKQIFATTLGRGLLTVEGREWRAQRRVIGSVFTPKMIGGFADAMVEAGRALAERWRSFPDNCTIDVASELPLATIHILEKTLFRDGLGDDSGNLHRTLLRILDTAGRLDPLDAIGAPRWIPRIGRLLGRRPLAQFGRTARAVVAEQQIRRGRLLTSAGVAVAETIINEQGLAERHYPYAGLSSVTGYYSIRYGVGGTEAAFDPILRGTIRQTAAEKWLDDLLHRPLVGRDVTLTIDLPAQVAADVALGQQEGAVVVMEIETGAILVMSSHPIYDPNHLDEMWDTLRQDRQAPLLNRATQGLFPVGDLARLMGLIGLYDAGVTVPSDPLEAPLTEMLAPLSQPGYLATARQLGLIRPLPGLPSQVGRLPDFENRGTVRDLAVTPLHLARVIAALELEGRLPTPMLSLVTVSAEPKQTQAIGPDTAHIIRSILPQVDEQLVGFEGQATPKETGQRWLSWFVGLAPAEAVEVEANLHPGAGAEAELILDPSQITPTPTPTVQAERVPARYAVVAVVVTDAPDRNPALRIARAPLKVILGQ